MSTAPHRVLLLGGSGQLGTEIRARWSGCDIAAPPHAEAALGDTAAVAAAIAASGADTLVNCAAFHNVDRCEREAESAFAANALAVSALAELCAQLGVTFVTISTDYVFAGDLGRPYREDDAPHPLNAYGVSKYAGELLVTRLQSRAFVVRTCGVYGTRISSTKGYTFVDRILTQARAGEALRIVNDQTVSPTYAGHLANALLDLLRSGAQPGLYHAVNEGAITWHAFAGEALRQAGIAHPIEGVSSATWASRVRRPAFSALENTKLRALGIRLPSWQDGIAAYLADRSLRPDDST